MYMYRQNDCHSMYFRVSSVNDMRIVVVQLMAVRLRGGQFHLSLEATYTV